MKAKQLNAIHEYWVIHYFVKQFQDNSPRIWHKTPGWQNFLEVTESLCYTELCIGHFIMLFIGLRSDVFVPGTFTANSLKKIVRLIVTK